MSDENKPDEDQIVGSNWMHGSLKDQEFPCVTAYFDESGHSASTRVVAIGGAMTTPQRWGDLRVRWKAALKRHGVEALHMTDLENRKGVFEEWDETKKRSLLTELFEAINAFPLFLIGAAVVVEDFNTLDAALRKRLMDPWYLCYQSCFSDVLTIDFLFRPGAEGIEPEFAHIRACFFEYHRQYKWGPYLFAMARESAKERGARQAEGVIGFGPKGASVHLELADMMAYELRKHIENAIYRLGRPTRWPMRQFLNGIYMANVFDDRNTAIPTEDGRMAIFRHGSLSNIGSNGAIRLVAQELPTSKVIDV